MTGPTYTGDGWTVLTGRWQDVGPDAVDVVISDPPYDERTHAAGARARDANALDFPPMTDGERRELLARAFGIGARWVVAFCPLESLGLWAEDARYFRGGLWIKVAPAPQFNGIGPAQAAEGIAILRAKGAKWNGGGRAGAWYATPERVRSHPTQKPVSLMLQLVEDFTRPGDIVWDPYAGVATTGVACLRLGRRFVGCEMQPHYAEIAAERLRAEERGLTLRDVRAGQTSIFDVEGVG